LLARVYQALTAMLIAVGYCVVCGCVVTDLSVLLNKLNEGFIALAAQLQVAHEAVKVDTWLLVVLWCLMSLQLV